MKTVLLFCFLPFISFAQNELEDGLIEFKKIPFSQNQIIYEKVITLDSSKNKDIIFNSIKSVLIKSTNYKYSKIDEDRISGNISCEINYSFPAKRGIAEINWLGTSLLVLDVKDYKYRIRITNSKIQALMFGVIVDETMVDSYLFEEKQVNKKKWKPKKSVILNWNSCLLRIINSIENSVMLNNSNDNF